MYNLNGKSAKQLQKRYLHLRGRQKWPPPFNPAPLTQLLKGVRRNEFAKLVRSYPLSSKQRIGLQITCVAPPLPPPQNPQFLMLSKAQVLDTLSIEPNESFFPNYFSCFFVFVFVFEKVVLFFLCVLFSFIEIAE